MVAITIPTATIKGALVEAVRELIVEMGQDITWSFKDQSPDENFRVVKQKLRTEDLIGEYLQGDVRATIDATTITKAPKKFDKMATASGQVYVVIDDSAIDVGIDNTVLVYKPILRG